jgi:hypothetical protein
LPLRIVRVELTSEQRQVQHVAGNTGPHRANWLLLTQDCDTTADLSNPHQAKNARLVLNSDHFSQLPRGYNLRDS